MKLIDGIEYEDGATVPVLGSLVNKGTSTERSYMGLAADAGKLPTIAKYPQYKGYLNTGASFFATDTKALKMYEVTTDAWV